MMTADTKLLPWAAATANSYRSKMIMTFFIALALFGVGVYLILPWISKLKEKQLGVPQCTGDHECPDKTVCSQTGVCVPDIVVPRVALDDPLGRGRDGEGTNVYRVAQVRE
jgi:hypothetical protein